MTATTAPGVGELLREWRRRRRLSQFDLSLEAAVSARHLSFVETGRSRPSRELLLHLAEHLDVPLRERNAILLAGGYAPVFSETPLDDDAMTPVRAALDKVLAAHEPYPAIIVDRRWDLVARNEAAAGFMASGVAPWLLEPPVNVLRLSLHPEGLAPRIANLAEWSEHLLTRLRRQLALAPDPAGAELYEELRGYPGVQEAAGTELDPAAMLFVPFELATDAGTLRFCSTLATFGTALDVTLAELSIEAFLPADAQTAAALG